MSGTTIDLNSTIKELEDIKPLLRKHGEYRAANMLDFAIGHLKRYQRDQERKEPATEYAPITELKY